MEETTRPEYILLPKRAIETVLCFQEIDFGEVGRLAGALQFGDVGREVIPWRQVDNREDHDTDRYQCRDHDQNAVHNVAEHLARFLSRCWRRDSHRRRFRRRLGLVEPEPVRFVNTEIGSRIPIVDSLLGDISKFVVDHYRLQYASDGSDREHLVRPDLKDVPPNSRVLFI